MEHVARVVGRDPLDVRKLNLYQKGQVCVGFSRLWAFVCLFVCFFLSFFQDVIFISKVTSCNLYKRTKCLQIDELFGELRTSVTSRHVHL